MQKIFTSLRKFKRPISQVFQYPNLTLTKLQQQKTNYNLSNFKINKFQKTQQLYFQPYRQFATKTLADYDKAIQSNLILNQRKFELQQNLLKSQDKQETLLIGQKIQEIDSKINNNIDIVMQRNSEYVKPIFIKNKQTKEKEQIEIRRLIPVSFRQENVNETDRRLIMENILERTPEINDVFWKPVLQTQYEQNLKQLGREFAIDALFDYYNQSGREINPTVGGLYPMFTANGKYIGFFSFRKSYTDEDSMEFSLYLTEEFRDKGFGEKIFKHAMTLAFLSTNLPQDIILLTWFSKNKKIEHIMQKYGLEVTRTDRQIKDKNVYEFHCGMINRINFIESQKQYPVEHCVNYCKKYVENQMKKETDSKNNIKI